MKWLDKLLGRNPPEDPETLPPVDSELPELSDTARAELSRFVDTQKLPATGDEYHGVP